MNVRDMRICVIPKFEGLIISLLFFFRQENNLGKLHFVIHLSLI